MSFFSWGERTEIRNDAKAQVRAELADREENVTECEINQKKQQIDLNIQGYKREQEVALNNNLIAQGAELEKTSFKLEQARFEITKEQVASDKLQLQKTLDQAKSDFEAQLAVQLMDEHVKNAQGNIELYDRVARAEAKVDAKDTVIASKDEEIARLDQLLKVTMGKLTQIDVKGLTIHVENEHKYSGKEKE
jgi:hypothetical protein